MARTKLQLTRISAARIKERNNKAITWIEFLAILTATPVPEQDVILTAMRNGRFRRAARLIFDEVDKKFTADALIEATAILADNNADLTELDRIL